VSTTAGDRNGGVRSIADDSGGGIRRPVEAKGAAPPAADMPENPERTTANDGSKVRRRFSQ